MYTFFGLYKIYAEYAHIHSLKYIWGINVNERTRKEKKREEKKVCKKKKIMPNNKKECLFPTVYGLVFRDASFALLYRFSWKSGVHSPWMTQIHRCICVLTILYDGIRRPGRTSSSLYLWRLLSNTHSYDIWFLIWWTLENSMQLTFAIIIWQL